MLRDNVKQAGAEAAGGGSDIVSGDDGSMGQSLQRGVYGRTFAMGFAVEGPKFEYL